MLLNERELVASQAVSRMGQILGSTEGMLADAVKQKLVLLFGAMDQVAQAANRPLLITDILPGYDMLIVRAEVVGHPETVPKAGMDVRALTPIDPSILHGLAMVLDGEFSVAKGGALLYESGDGTHYIGFQSKNRAIALNHMGIYAEDTVLMAEVDNDTQRWTQ